MSCCIVHFFLCQNLDQVFFGEYAFLDNAVNNARVYWVGWFLIFDILRLQLLFELLQLTLLFQFPFPSFFYLQPSSLVVATQLRLFETFLKRIHWTCLTFYLLIPIFGIFLLILINVIVDTIIKICIVVILILSIKVPTFGCEFNDLLIYNQFLDFGRPICEVIWVPYIGYCWVKGSQYQRFSRGVLQERIIVCLGI